MTTACAVERLTFAYPALAPSGEAHMELQDVNFELRSGEWVVLLGATGCGKTTLCGVLAGLVPRMTGGVLNGKITLADGQSIGFVFQDADAQLFNMTVEDEIAFGLETSGLTRAETQLRVQRWLKWARLDGLAARAPWQLSGGQKKRLALASVLALAPQVLILDDPTAGLDPIGAQEVMDALNDLRRDARHTVFLATADPELAARYADRILVMHAGRVVKQGAPREVFVQNDRLQAIGVGLPQMIALAHELRARGKNAEFISVDEAEVALRQAQVECKKETDCNHAPVKPIASPLIVFDHVWFRYPDADFALRDVSLSIAGGSFTALVGANGSGKTTLAKQVNGLLRPTQGRVLLNGNDIARTPTAQLAQRVGYVFQNPDHQIFGASVREEIAFGLRNIRLDEAEIARRVQTALGEFDLHDLADTPPAILNYGARRLVTLASTWAMQPAMWVLDEPTTGLDARHADMVLRHAVNARQNGATIILISHDVARVAACAERVVVLDDGQIVGDGAPRDIFSNEALLATARLTPPPVTMLARRLGWSFAPLTITEFVEAAS